MMPTPKTLTGRAAPTLMGAAVVGFCAVWSASPLPAQQPEGHEQAWEQRRRAECRLAHQVLTKGQPANKREWALGKIRACDELAGEAIAAELDRHRPAETRTDELERLVFATAAYVDGRIVAQALDVAADPTAGAVARVQAIRILSYQIMPASYASYEEFASPPEGILEAPIFIPATEGYDQGPVEVTPAQVEAIATTLASVAEDPSTPEVVRNAATKVAAQARLELR